MKNKYTDLNIRFYPMIKDAYDKADIASSFVAAFLCIFLAVNVLVALLVLLGLAKIPENLYQVLLCEIICLLPLAISFCTYRYYKYYDSMNDELSVEDNVLENIGYKYTSDDILERIRFRISFNDFLKLYNTNPEVYHISKRFHGIIRSHVICEGEKKKYTIISLAMKNPIDTYKFNRYMNSDKNVVSATGKKQIDLITELVEQDLHKLFKERDKNNDDEHTS